MKKFKVFTPLIVTVLFMTFAFAADPDPGYFKAFGYGSIAVSKDDSYPAFGTYDPSQFEYKNGVFYREYSPDMQLNMRALFPKGMNPRKLFDKLHKDRPNYMKFRTVDQASWTIWCSHDNKGEKELFSKEKPWPKKLSDIPKWDEITNVIWSVPEEYLDDAAAGFSWEGIDPATDQQAELKSYFANLKPGVKLYVVYRVFYIYLIPGGKMESKWDSDLNKFVEKPAPDMIGYEYSDPIMACTIELK